MKPVAPAGRSLRSISIFENVPDESLERLAARCQWSQYDDGEEILPYLDERDDVYFLASGKARVIIYSLNGKAVAFRDIHAGGLFGELAAIDQKPRSARVESCASSIVAHLPAAAFRAALREQACVMEAVTQHLVSQIRDLTARIFEFSTLPVKTRIQSEIVRLAGDPPDDAGPCRIPRLPTHGDFAVHVSTHREAVTREIGRLTRLGIVRREGRDLIIEDIAALRRMIERGSED